MIEAHDIENVFFTGKFYPKKIFLLGNFTFYEVFTTEKRKNTGKF